MWQTRRMFYNSAARFFNPNADLSKLLKLDVGGFNALLGKSYGEIAAESRSMHRSQGFGSAKQRGENFEYFKPIKGDTANLKNIFDGIDFSWKRVKDGKAIDEKIAKIVKDYKIEEPGKSIDKLLPLYIEFTSKYNYHHDLSLQLIQVLSGISLDAYTSNCNTTYGDTINQNYSIISRNIGEIRYRLIISEVIHKGESAIESTVDSIVNGTLQKNKLIVIPKKYFTKGTFENSELYFLKKGIKNNLYDIEDTRFRQYPNFQRLSNATLTLYFKETEVYFNLKQQYKWVDPSHGELYRPLVITPPVMINIEQKSIVFADENEKEIKVIVKAGKDHAKFDLKFSLPQGWKIKPHPAMNVGEPSNIFGIKNLEMDKKGEDLSISLFVTAPSIETVAILKATAIVDGIEYSKGIKEIKYDHIPIQTWFPDAEAKLVKLDIKTKSKHIGYIPGAGDEVQQCLQQLGYEVTTLTDEKLSKENLSQFDAIVTGIRAYNTNEKLPNYKQKLMDYVSDGGNLIVQYNTNNFLSQLNGNIGPYPFKVTRDRVTD
ncbi:MAG: LmbE family protein, partial [Bacteroidota bacterium]